MKLHFCVNKTCKQDMCYTFQTEYRKRRNIAAGELFLLFLLPGEQLLSDDMSLPADR